MPVKIPDDLPAASILEYLGAQGKVEGTSFLKEILNA